MKKQLIRDVYNGIRKYHKNLIFCRIDKTEYDRLVNECTINDLLDDPNKIIVMSNPHLYENDLIE